MASMSPSAALVCALLLPQLLLCVSGQPRSSVARSRGSARGPSLEQARDGTWLQKIVLQGWALPGWPGVRHAFSHQSVDISCPSSQEFLVVVSVLKEVTVTVGRPGRQRQVDEHFEQVQERHCQGSAGAAPKRGGAHQTQTPAPGSSCTVSVPAVGAATLTLVQPGHPSVAVSPEPCILTARPALSPTLLASCLAGVALLLFSHAAVRSPAGQAAIRLYCAVAPVATAFANVIKLALTGIAVALALTMAALSAPGTGEQDSLGLGKGVRITAAVVGVLIFIIVLATGLAVRSGRYQAYRRTRLSQNAPWLGQLAGAGLICSNSMELNWLLRCACFGSWFLFGRSSAAAAGAGAAAAQQAPAATAAPASQEQRQREQRERLQAQLLSKGHQE